MPAAKLPKKLHAQLDFLAARVRRLRVLRAAGRAAFLLPSTALVCILADAYLGLPMVVRLCLAGGWLLLLLREGWSIFRAMTAPVDLESVAFAVEEEFPRLAERLTTAVELSEHADESNGSPALVNEVIRDADSRARKLDLATAFPTSGPVASFVTALVLFGLLLIPAFVAPRGGEFVRRFFLPWHTPTKVYPYKVVVTSGDPAIKRGDPVNLTAYIEATKPDAELPTSATLVISVNGKEERLPMTGQEGNVWLARRTAGEGDFDYRVEAGGAVSDTHHVTVVEPVTLAAAHVTIQPPAYAALGRDRDPPVEGLGELTALQHSTITFDLKFAPKPIAASLEFVPTVDPEAKPVHDKFPLKVADDGTATLVVPARTSGTFTLTAEGGRSVKSEFPPQPLHVRKDEAPKLPRVTGLGDKVRQVRPTEKIVVETTATDDVAIAALVLEWKIDDGAVQTLPLTTRGLPASQIDGTVVLPLTGKVKVGQRISCRLAATDNRNLPDFKLTPQTTYFPARDWAEFVVDANAEPLAEQDIRGRQAEVDRKLQQIQDELRREWRDSDDLRKAAASARPLNTDRANEVRDNVKETSAKVDDLARDVGITPDLSRLSEALRGLADRELRDADAALNKAKDEAKSSERAEQFKKAEDAIDAALRKVDDLRKENEKLAKDRLDKRKLEDLAQEQQDLADKAKTADPKDADELAKKQKELEDQLNKLKEQSEAIKNATDAIKADQANKLADEAKKLADEMRDLNQAMKRADKDSTQERLAELKKKQDELTKKAKDLAEKTDTPTRIAQTAPLNSDDAQKAKDALDQNNLDEAVKQQEKLRQELERLARDLEQAAANSKDPREAARQLARLQEELRNRLAQETKEQGLDKLPAGRRQALEKQQEAIERATSKLKAPANDLPAESAKQRAVGDTQQAREMLKKGAEKGADRKMQEAKESLEKLADALPSKEQRLQRAKEDLAKLKQQQDAIRQQTDNAAEGAKKQDPDAAATQQDLAKKLADAAKKQADLADQLEKTDAPGHDARKDKAADTLQRAAGDLTAGRPQDAQASQQAAKRELERLEQALNGQTPADEKAAELAKKQKQLAEDAAKNAASVDKSGQQELQKRQADIARDVEKLQTPEAATAQAEAADAAKKAAADNQKPDDMAKKTKEAAAKLDLLNRQINGDEHPADAADRLAKKQKANADEQEKRKDNAGTGEARKKAAQELDELKNMRAGQDAQKAKQQAQDALQKAANHLDPQANAKAQREAAEALKDLADKLSRDKTAKTEPKNEDAADAAERLAKKQKELAEQTKRDADEAKKQPGDAGKKASKEAAAKSAGEQKNIAKQAGEMPGRDSPKDLQQAQEAMNKAEEELGRENLDGAAQKQKEAADALERLARKAQENKQERANADNQGLPSKDQADAARQLAEEQRKLQEEARKANEDLAKEGAAPKNNPVEELAKQQQEIAREAGDLAKKVADRQGEKSEQSKEAKQAADAAKQTAGQMKNGDLNQAKESGKQAAQAMERMAQDKAGGDTGQKSKDLARRQADLNQKLDEMAKDPGAGRAQQAARQQQLEEKARGLSQKLDEMAKGSDPTGKAGEQIKDGARSAGKSGEQMQQAREAGRKGQRDQAGEAREQAAQSMERAAQQANEAAKQLGGGEKGNGSSEAGQSIEQAKGAMDQAGKQLGQGKPGDAAGSMQKAAGSLQQAAGQLGQGSQGQSQSGQGNGMNSQTSGGKIGGPGGTLDLRQFSPDVAQHTGKPWGELPGEIKTKIVQEMKARYGEDYARNIKLYFEQLAERK
ncbi:MAG TPA: hypothetical protein VHR66_14805 [Gemmataceae bacterium]|jgi:hypothetical protein|nr:hypothetical protein [Gemmataceae bacterium]